MSLENNSYNWSWLQLVPLLFVAGLIFYFSSQPSTSLHMPEFTGADKVFHFIAYFTLVSSFLVSLPGRMLIENKVRVVSSIFVFCLLYALIDELHQFFVPGRSPDLLDILADMSAAGVVAVIFLTNHKRLVRLLTNQVIS